MAATAERTLTATEREDLGDLLRRQAAEREAFIARLQRDSERAREEFRKATAAVDAAAAQAMIADMLQGGSEYRQGRLNPATEGRVTLVPHLIYPGNLGAVDLRTALARAREDAAVGTTPVALVCVRGRSLRSGEERPRPQEWFERMVAVVDLSAILPPGKGR